MSGNAGSIPQGMNSIAFISPCLQTLMISHTFLILIIPLLVALFYYSTPCCRRQPIFILNIIALTLAVAAGLASDVYNIHMVLSPEDMWPQLQLAIGFISIFQVMLVDTILLVRLITVHPLNRVGVVRFSLLMFLPILLKIARVVNVILYINQMSILASGSNPYPKMDAAWITLPYQKIEWIAQMVDNSYASISFLWTISQSRIHSVTTPSSLWSALTLQQTSFSQRLRILSNIALSNFIIPTVLSIAQLALAFRIGAANPILLNDITFVNAMVSVFGVVFATVWAGREHRREANIYPNSIAIRVEHEQEHTCGLDGWRVAPHAPATNPNESCCDSDKAIDLAV